MTATMWFLVTEEGRPVGRHLQEGDSPFPTVGERITNGDGWKVAEVVAFEELAPVCAMRRFKVTIRVLK